MRKGRAPWRVDTLGQIATYDDGKKAAKVPRSALFDPPPDIVGYDVRASPTTLGVFWDEHCSCPGGVVYTRDDVFDEVAQADCRSCAASFYVSMFDYAVNGLPREVDEDG